MSTTESNGGTESSSSSAQWSNLPDELLAMIRDRLTASPWARVRLAAACKSWRAASSRLSAPPAVPLLLVWSWVELSGQKRLCGPDDTCVVRVPDKAENMRLVGSHDGGWIVAVKYCRIAIVNLFSGDEVTLAPICSNTLFCTPRKIIFSEDPTSNGCILASIANHRREIALCKIGGHGSRWTTTYAEDTETKTVSDIMFWNGKLYGIINPGEELVMFKIHMEEDGTPVIASTNRLNIQRRHGPTNEDDPMAYNCHMVKLYGRPSMAIRTRWLPHSEPFFKVFALVHTDNAEAYKYKWGEVTSFGDQALFLGPFSSKALPVAAVDQRHGLERNHIYYTKHKSVSTVEFPYDAVYPMEIADNQHICCKDDQSVGDGVERTGYYMTGVHDLGMWIYPPDL